MVLNTHAAAVNQRETPHTSSALKAPEPMSATGTVLSATGIVLYRHLN